MASFFALIFPISSRSRPFIWPFIFYFWLASTIATVAVRSLRRGLTIYLRKHSSQIIIVGSGNMALDLLHTIEEGALSEYKYEVIGLVDFPEGNCVPDDI